MRHYGPDVLDVFTAPPWQHERWTASSWSQAHGTPAFYRRPGRREPAVLPGRETDVVVFLAPA